jgi:hypothetical protein
MYVCMYVCMNHGFCMQMDVLPPCVLLITAWLFDLETGRNTFLRNVCNILPVYTTFGYKHLWENLEPNDSFVAASVLLNIFFTYIPQSESHNHILPFGSFIQRIGPGPRLLSKWLCKLKGCNGWQDFTLQNLSVVSWNHDSRGANLETEAYSSKYCVKKGSRRRLSQSVCLSLATFLKRQVFRMFADRSILGLHSSSVNGTLQTAWRKIEYVTSIICYSKVPKSLMAYDNI